MLPPPTLDNTCHLAHPAPLSGLSFRESQGLLEPRLTSSQLRVIWSPVLDPYIKVSPNIPAVFLRLLWTSSAYHLPYCWALSMIPVHEFNVLMTFRVCRTENWEIWSSHPRWEGDLKVKLTVDEAEIVQQSCINIPFVLFMCSFPSLLISLLLESS